MAEEPVASKLTDLQKVLAEAEKYVEPEMEAEKDVFSLGGNA